MDFWNAKSCLTDFLKPPRHFQILSEFLFLIKAPPVSASPFTYIKLVHSVPDMKLLTIFFMPAVSHLSMSRLKWEYMSFVRQLQYFIVSFFF